MKFTLILALLPCLLWLGFANRRLLQYLRFFQQEGYDGRRFTRWLVANRAWDRRGSVTLLVTALVAAWLPNPSDALAMITGFVALFVVAWREPDPRSTGKLPLRMTARATRIHLTALLVLVVLGLALISCVAFFGFRPRPWWVAGLALPLVQLPPFALILGNRFLAGYEARHSASFVREAETRLETVQATALGITGSYGKTSTKHILGKLLGGPSETFWSTGSVNTPMGITREIRERMTAAHRWAVFEMAAYGVGSIRRLCEFVHPQHGIITNIGLMHLERFGSREAICRAKSELAEGLPDGGILVLNREDSMCRRVAEQHARLDISYFGLKKYDEPGCYVTDVQRSVEGTTFRLSCDGDEHVATTRLHGKPAMANVVAAFTLAWRLGVQVEYLLAAIRNLEPERNRLQVERAGDVTYVHDAYNSNPVGFESALDVLRELPAKRRILLTPGMIELGPRQDAENEQVARRAADICDVVLLVGDTNRAALETGLRRGRRPVDVHAFGHRNEAFDALHTLLTPGDAVLIENDLSDVYELEVAF